MVELKKLAKWAGIVSGLIVLLLISTLFFVNISSNSEGPANIIQVVMMCMIYVFIGSLSLLATISLEEKGTHPNYTKIARLAIIVFFSFAVFDTLFHYFIDNFTTIDPDPIWLDVSMMVSRSVAIQSALAMIVLGHLSFLFFKGKPGFLRKTAIVFIVLAALILGITDALTQFRWIQASIQDSEFTFMMLYGSEQMTTIVLVATGGLYLLGLIMTTILAFVSKNQEREFR